MHTTNSGRVFHYYLPVFYWFEQTLAKHRESSAKPLVVGISAPQGCGKTTLVTALETLFAHRAVTCGTVSIDDFYLTFADQSALAEANPDNSLLQVQTTVPRHIDLSAFGRAETARAERRAARTRRRNNSVLAPLLQRLGLRRRR